MSRPHEVLIGVDGDKPVTLSGIKSFEFTSDMLEMADPFSLTMPFHPKLWGVLPTDAALVIFLDDTEAMNGFVDRREKDTDRGGGSIMQVSGRDRGGRLVDESAPLGNHIGKGVLELGEAMAGPWFDSVSLSNARNRRLIGGKSKALAGVSREPAISKGRDVSKKVEPGETRAQVLQSFLEEAGLLAWSSSDGTELIIGKPNYDQMPQYRFFQSAPGSSRANETNVISMGFSEDVSELYSRYTVCGSSKGNGANYGKNVMRRRATVDGDIGPTGTILFQRPKHLLISDDDIRSSKQARERGEREMALRFASAFEFHAVVPNWGQPFRGTGEPVIYSFDKVATFEDEESETVQDCLITRVEFSESKQGGQQASVSMVPMGTELVFS